MRKTWAKLIHQAMKADPDIVVITPDMGFGVLDNIAKDYPDRFYNVSIAETMATNLAVGLALGGKKPWVYGILTFTLYKALEQIRNYVTRLGLPVKYVLVGKDKTYEKLDFSHWAIEDKEIAKAIGLSCFEPENIEELERCFPVMQAGEKPLYLRLP